MIENVNGVKKVDVFNDIVSRLEDSKKARVSDDVVSGMKNYYNNKPEYRNRVNLLAENLKGIKPVDSEVNNVIYLSNYMEKGIAIKTSIISFKQIWIEYRLIYNENTYKEENNIPTYNLDSNINTANSFEQSVFEQPKVDIPQFENQSTVDIPTINIGDKNIEMPTDEPKTNFDLPSFDNNVALSNYNNQSMFDMNKPNNNFEDLTTESKNEFNFSTSPLTTNNYEFDSLNNNLEEISIKLDDNYKKLYTKIVGINKYVENFNRKKIDLDRQISALEERRNNLTSELRELENAKKEFSRYKEKEEKRISEMKNEVNNRVLSLQNLIDNLDTILGKIN